MRLREYVVRNVHGVGSLRHAVSARRRCVLLVGSCDATGPGRLTILESRHRSRAMTTLGNYRAIEDEE